MGGRTRAPRSDAPRHSGQHFLRSSRLATELVEQANVAADEVLLEIGAGKGRLTLPLALRARRVIAVELDPDLADGLRRRFGADRRVEVVQANVLDLPLPRDPFRAFGNIPFASTTAILRMLLDDPGSPLTRADLVVQDQAARKRASIRPSALLSLGWLPWWELTLTRHLPAGCFEPRPSVDAAMLRVTRRRPALLPAEKRLAFVRLLRGAFTRSARPLRHSLRAWLSPSAWKRLARERGLAVAARPRDLDVFDWVELYRLVEAGDPPRM